MHLVLLLFLLLTLIQHLLYRSGAKIIDLEQDSEDDSASNGFALLFSESGGKYQIVGSSMFKSAFINKNGSISKRLNNYVFRHTHSASHSRYQPEIFKFNEKCRNYSFDELKLINLKSRKDLVSKVEFQNLENEFGMKMELSKERVTH